MRTNHSAPMNTNETIKIGDWLIDPIHSSAAKEGTSKRLEKRLLKVLLVLAEHDGEPVKKDIILEAAWAGKHPTDDTLSVAISNLRKIFSCSPQSPSFIETISGYGYRLLVPVQHNFDAANDNIIKAPPKANLTLYRYGIALLLTVLLASVAYVVITDKNIEDENGFGMQDYRTDEFFLKSVYLITDNNRTLETLDEAIVLLKSLDTSNPNTSEIHYYLGQGYLFKYFYSPPAHKKTYAAEAEKAFLHSIYLNPKNHQSLNQLASVSMFIHHNLLLAKNYYIRAISAAPQFAEAHIAYATCLLAMGNFDRALHHNKIGMSLKPAHYASPSHVWIFSIGGDYENASRSLAKLFTLDPDSINYHRSGMKLYEIQGIEKKAFEFYLQSFKRVGYSEEDIASANKAFNDGGLKQLNHWLANIKKELADIGQGTPPFSTARYHAAAGEHEQSLDLLEAIEKHEPFKLLWIKVEPKFSGMRTLPRFVALTTRLGISNFPEI